MQKALVSFAATLALGSLLAGCSAIQPAAPVAANGQSPTTTGFYGAAGGFVNETTIDMVGRFQIENSTGYRLMSTETAFNLGNIDHVTLTLQRFSGGTWSDVTGFTAKQVAQAQLGAPLNLRNLRMATQYKIVARAFADAAETQRIDNTLAADNEITFTTPSLSVSANQVNSTTGDTISTAAQTVLIKVKLTDKIFAGQATSGTGVQVTNGTIINTTVTETF